VNRGQIEYAERQAMQLYDEWNDFTGFVSTGNGYYNEIQGIIEDAVHIGIQVALFGKVIKDKNGDISREYKEHSDNG